METMTIEQIEGLSDADLDAAILDLNNERDAMRDHIDEMQAERSKRASKARIEAKLASLSPEEREALTQHVAVAGIAKK